MIIGVLSDTHEDPDGALLHIIGDFVRRGVEFVIHCGDLERPEHIPMFGNLPVICALNQDQINKPWVMKHPENWSFTTPGDRFRFVDGIKVYIGHKRYFDFLKNSTSKFVDMIEEMRNENDGLQIVFAGHTHHDVFVQTHMVNVINPGAVARSFDGYEYAIVDTKTLEIIFCRIPKTVSTVSTFSVGVISDSLDISRHDVSFWSKLAKELHRRDVTHIIHCGNISNKDIGKIEALDGFIIHCNLINQSRPKTHPGNWHFYNPDEPVVEINGYNFCMRFDLSAELENTSERGMSQILLALKQKYPDIYYVLCGLTCNAFLEENEHNIRILNPGDIVKDRNFAVICLPRNEITFGHVPVDPLPPLITLQ